MLSSRIQSVHSDSDDTYPLICCMESQGPHTLKSQPPWREGTLGTAPVEAGFVRSWLDASPVQI